jgi:signal transduction histidine kinase
MPFPLITTKQKYETEIAKRAMEACEQIATEMGAEVHDDLIQKLTIFSLYLDRLERATHHPTEIESLLLKMRGDFQEMASSVRSISRQLMPVRIEGESFQKNMELLCQNLERPGQGRVHFEATSTEEELPAQIKVHLHRIAQELVHNAFKHSAAWHVWVRLLWTKKELMLEVEDDGTAFSTMEEQISKLESKHNTLKMRSLAIGASLSYHQGKKGLVGRVRFKILNKQ